MTIYGVMFKSNTYRLIALPNLDVYQYYAPYGQFFIVYSIGFFLASSRGQWSVRKTENSILSVSQGLKFSLRCNSINCTQ
ncbi:hypothetical protein BDV36DRAFT_269374 [Aspergillus pseudocaelatus]|uniref:Uncharacterized protein n=1 Tax=Aspergillus pseudocaelatus TaxID=1825620 RepID=A0ABQ6WAD4_9EURO|nr:hypothetical protein BDV36DRAFT_269374 [Aspergillus pseudocaelatus]